MFNGVTINYETELTRFVRVTGLVERLSPAVLAFFCLWGRAFRCCRPGLHLPFTPLRVVGNSLGTFTSTVSGPNAAELVSGRPEVTLYINLVLTELYDEMADSCPPDLGGRPRRR